VRRARNAGGAGAATLHQTGDDPAVGPPQTVDRDTLAGGEARGFRHEDGLTQHPHGADRNAFDRPDHFARHVDRVRPKRAVFAPRDYPHDLADAKAVKRSGFVVDENLRVGGVRDPSAIDEDAAETLDRANEAGSADAAIRLVGACRSAGPADALVARRICGVGRASEKCGSET
jgi:hypothetical protein